MADPDTFMSEDQTKHYMRAGSRLSVLFGQHIPRELPTDGTLLDWRVYATALLARAHYLLESTHALHKRTPDAAVLTRVLYEHIITFCWLCIAPDENIKKLMFWELCERRKGINDLKSIGQYNEELTGIDDFAALLGPNFSAPDPGLPALAREADVHWSPRFESIWAPGKGGLRTLYPSLYRHFSAFTHPTVAGLYSFVSLHGSNTARIGRPQHTKASSLTLAPIVFAFGLLVAGEALGWPPREEVLAAFEHDEAEEVAT